MSFGNYGVVIDGEVQSYESCDNSGCKTVPNELIQHTGTTVAWVATPAAPASEPGAASRASALGIINDRNGVECIGPGFSQTSIRRIQVEVTCLLLDSPGDVSAVPLFPDALSSAQPAPSPTIPSRSGGNDSAAMPACLPACRWQRFKWGWQRRRQQWQWNRQLRWLT